MKTKSVLYLVCHRLSFSWQFGAKISISIFDYSWPANEKKAYTHGEMWSL